MFRMAEDFDKGHAAGARNIPYYVYVAPRGLFQIQEMFLLCKVMPDDSTCFCFIILGEGEEPTL
jgi:hypothetical protein